jgi:hypothetical protein
MKLDEAYDDNNIFAKILRGDLPSFKVYEDAHTLAFMDIMPQSPGSCAGDHQNTGDQFTDDIGRSGACGDGHHP